MTFALWFRSTVFKWIKVFRSRISAPALSKIYSCILREGDDDIDPYIVARLIPFPDITGKTSVAYGAGEDPEWIEGNVISLNVPKATGGENILSHIHLECWDRDRFTWDDYLGGFTIDMFRADGTPETFGKGPQDYQLRCGDVITGELTLEIRITWDGKEETEVPSNTSTTDGVEPQTPISRLFSVKMSRLNSMSSAPSVTTVVPSPSMNGGGMARTQSASFPRDDANFEVPSLPWYAEESVSRPLATLPAGTNAAFAGSQIEITVRCLLPNSPHAVLAIRD
ncbi:hypothetical protein CYMTET_13850 [Cymbomonas tetramitiformis]|uniref:C2 domain-containing protein n=1 Tax=Cymbomonas tetramitiformis TaxID=36881 RepID=A0AAE0GHK2_9CHLO|nr:hypothetical protein CYMTET_13850 [Cymbomonas tetramitiformis]